MHYILERQLLYFIALKEAFTITFKYRNQKRKYRKGNIL